MCCKTDFMRTPTKCIYCGTAGELFPRDHVIPEAFGRFENNFTLGCVCGDCNSYFGRELELFLARDSGEALLRLRYGVKRVSEAQNLRNTRIKMTVNVAGPWYGAQVVLIADETVTKLTCEQLPQVGFRRDSRESFHWFTEDQLSDPATFAQYRESTEINIVGPSEDAVTRLGEKLRELGMPFKKTGVLGQPRSEGGQIETKVLSQIDQIILRGVAMVAFNYAAYVQGETFLLHSDFNDFRRFVRLGEEPHWKPAVFPSTKPILYDDSHRWRQTNGHLVTLGWNKHNRGILAQVSLFNYITYHVLLCPARSGLWHSLSIGHHFEIESQTISELGSASRIRIVKIGQRS